MRAFESSRGSVLIATATALAQGRAALNPRTEPPALNSLRPRRSADSTIALSFEDLPDGFTPVFVDVPGMLIGSDSFPDAQLSGVFAFEHSNGLEFVEGFVVRFKHLAECEAFDEDLNDNHRLDLLIQEWKTSLDIVKVESISGATAGDNSTFMSMLVQEDRRRGELEVALFRRRRFGSFIAVFHPSTVRPHASIEDLARKLDDTICSQMAGCDNIGPAPACTDLPTSRGEQSLTATS